MNPEEDVRNKVEIARLKAEASRQEHQDRGLGKEWLVTILTVLALAVLVLTAVNGSHGTKFEVWMWVALIILFLIGYFRLRR